VPPRALMAQAIVPLLADHLRLVFAPVGLFGTKWGDESEWCRRIQALDWFVKFFDHPRSILQSLDAAILIGDLSPRCASEGDTSVGVPSLLDLLFLARECQLPLAAFISLYPLYDSCRDHLSSPQTPLHRSLSPRCPQPNWFLTRANDNTW